MEIRTFDGGGLRSSAKGKIEFYGIRNPLAENSFGKYMMKHQVMENGELRSASNWWSGWSTEVSLQSMVRHCEDLQALEAGFRVFKIRSEAGEETVYLKEYPTSIPCGATIEEVYKIETAHAIRFNATAYVLKELYDHQY